VLVCPSQHPNVDLLNLHPGVGWCDPALDHAKQMLSVKNNNILASQLHALLGSNALLKKMHDSLCPFASTVHV
jgi:hypothetical protein